MSEAAPAVETTIAGSLPKPSWLARPQELWAPWQLAGEQLAEGKRDAVRVALKMQEAAGIDIVSEGEQSRMHFVHGFLRGIEGIDFARMKRIGIRADRYEADCPTVAGPVRRPRPVHADEVRFARASTRHKLKFTLPGPMTMVDTLADEHYRDRAALGLALAAVLNADARELAALGVDVIQFDEPAFNVYMDEVRDWGIAALERVAAVRIHVPAARKEHDPAGLARMCQFARADGADRPPRGQGRAGRRDRRRDRCNRDAGAGGGNAARSAPAGK